MCAAAVLAGCGTAVTPAPDPAGSPAGTPGPPAATLAVVDALPVKGRAPRTGYSRGEFGSAWADVDHNGCDTRNDVLARDLTGTARKPGTRGCVVLSGTLRDPYSGRTIAFRRGPRSADVQIDHVVALSNAWQTGAQGWPAARR
ncbi:MAG TPA: HNH endonuclease family protein, partial [Mycobacteriales bacterium]